MLELFRYMAWLSTVLFLLKTVLVMVGGHHGGAGHDGSIASHGTFHVDGHSTFAKATHVHHALHRGSGFDFKLWSFQSVLAFCMGMGWTGQAALLEWDWSITKTILASSAFGFLMAVLSAVLMGLMTKLNLEPDEYNLSTCVGKSAKVYLPIPNKGEGSGQVEIELGGGLKIVSAVSNGTAIKQFEDVRVTSAQDNMVVVSPINQ